MAVKRTFDEVRNVSPKHCPSCPICGEAYEADAFRGRVQLVLYRHKPASAAPKSYGDSKAKQLQLTVGSESRIMCESCSVEIFERMAEELPARQKKRGDKGE